MRKVLGALACTLLLACSGGSETEPADAGIDAGGSSSASSSSSSGAGGSDAGSTSGGDFDQSTPNEIPLYYMGGLVMYDPINVYIIWYGDHAKSSKSLIQEMISNLGTSPWWQITTKYYQSLPMHAATLSRNETKFVTNNITLKQSVVVTTDIYGTQLTKLLIQQVILDQIKAGTLPSDTNGQYLFLAAPGINETLDFYSYCSDFCGWHTQFVDSDGNTLKYLFAENSGQCPNCSLQAAYQSLGYQNSPNGDFFTDDMMTVIAHEMSETATDPDYYHNPAWQNGLGGENADACAWVFGDTLKTSDGQSAYNTVIGGKEYMIQQNWVLSKKACGSHL